GEVFVQLAGLEAAQADDVPEGALEIAGELVAAVGGEGDPAGGGGVEHGEAAAVGDAPQADGVMRGAGGKGGAVGAERDAVDRIGVACETVDADTVGDAPQADGVVLGAGGEGGAVGAECDAVDRTGVSSELAEGGAVGDAP